MCLFHKWSKWEQYTRDLIVVPTGILYPKSVQGKEFEKTEMRQKRVCLKCNKVQDEEV